MFCTRQKDDLHSIKLVFVPTQKVLKRHLCLVLLQVPKCFVPVQIFVSDQKFICILRQLQTFYGRPKDDLHSVTLVFYAGTKNFEEALNAVKLLGWHKTFGPAQKILGPVKGQGITLFINDIFFIPVV